MKMRDWPLYRIRHAHHYRTRRRVVHLPALRLRALPERLIEGITHSICTLEFENNRELYDWILDAVGAPRDARPHQYEFARLNLSYTVMSKRKLLELVTRGIVDGWDDPRMPTISGLRRRGTTPEAIRAFCERIGVAKNNSTVELELFEHVLREDLDARSPRFMAVLRPLRVVVDNLPEGHVETIEAPLWPEALAPAAGGPTSRPLPFSRHLLIERDDFSASPPPDFFRLAPGREVRLRHAYVARCTSFELDPSTGEPTVVHVELDLESKGAPRKTKGTLHWVSEPHAGTAEVRLYDRLFEGDDDTSEVSARSLELIAARVEPALLEHAAGAHVQLERLGFFFTDPKLSCPGAPVFGRTVGLKDAWARATARAKEPRPSAPEGSPSAVEGPDAKKPDAKKPDAKKPDAKVASEAEPLSPEARALVLAHGLPEAEARRLTEPGAHAAELARLFEAARGHGGAPRALSKWLVNEVSHRGRVAGLEKLTPAALAGLVELAESGALSAAQAREVLGLLLTSGGDPREIMAARGLGQITDDAALVAVIDAVLAEADELVARYRGGQTSLLGALVGQVMRKAGGKAPAKRVGELLKERLG
jgi:glutaminyl-tRNA synthetase